MGHRPLLAGWRKQRYRCLEPRCPQRVFTERSEQVEPRHRLMTRLRQRLERAASRSAQAVSDVAAEYDVSWWSVHHALVVAAVERAARELSPVRTANRMPSRAARWSVRRRPGKR